MSVVASVSFAATIPKDGLTDEQSEDQYQVAPDLRAFAVSDGATHSLHARLWARCLVDRFCEAPQPSVSQEWLKPAGFRFFQSIDVNALPWHALAKLNEGTFATLAGITLSGDSAAIDGFVVGDSCLVIWSPGSDPSFFPPYGSQDLQLDPYLISTLADLNEASLPGARRLGPVHLPLGLTLVAIMTDAVARWFLEQAVPAGMQEPLERLLRCESRDDFEGLIAAARANEGMKNDDCTLLVVEIFREPDSASSDPN
jgi:hypothetical protein